VFVYKLGEVRAVRRKSLVNKATGEVSNTEAVVTVESTFVDTDGNERLDMSDFSFDENVLGGALLSAKGKHIAVVCEYNPSFFNRSNSSYYESSVRQVRNAPPILFDRNPAADHKHLGKKKDEHNQ
jgi:hypothetical protein